MQSTVGGPDRPIPERIALEKTKSAEDDANGGVQSTAAGIAASAVAVQANLYNKLTSALGERGYVICLVIPLSKTFTCSLVSVVNSLVNLRKGSIR